MTEKEVMRELERCGTAQNRKVYARHGVDAEMFGVSFAHLKKLRTKIKTDHELALRLWRTGNHDARVLATMIADPAQATARMVNDWAKDLSNYVITDAFAHFASKTRQARKKMEQWTKSPAEWKGTAGWNLLALLAMQDEELPDECFEQYLKTIQRDIHNRKNHIRHAMNGALIAIGIRNAKLEAKALDAARAIGKVEVDHGETSCQTPDAAGYIQKTWQHRKKTGKRGRSRMPC